MLRAMLCLLAGSLFVSDGAAQGVSCGPETDLVSLMRCSSEAVSLQPEAKRAGLCQPLMDAASAVGGEPLARETAAQHRECSLAPEAGEPAYPDYGWQAAQALIREGGPARLIEAARARQGALRYGRAEALLAAGIRAAGYHQDSEEARRLAAAPGLAARLNGELLSLAQAASDFERGDLAHAAAKLATYRCDQAAFDRATRLVMAPEAVRYTFWRARVTGERSRLPEAIMTGAASTDTRPLRQGLEGLALLGELGDCTD
ncbi:hypothetical protein [Henriciella aquimarina]|uniref:hypothetical protein n=1 Tax=Henriciella aquimarina TaxID=545261 RepID=UPI00117BBE7C|nr:hypothetical protein [Henriciella aquimarina]